MSAHSRTSPMSPANPTKLWNPAWPAFAKSLRNNCCRIYAMKTNRDFEGNDPLLNAVLGDEGWQTANAAGKAAALVAFQARQRARRAMQWTGCVVALAVGIACGAHWLSRSVTPPRQIAAKPADAPREPLTQRSLTDAELIASFPEGSCFLAEIDGKKQLVFLNQEIERRYVAKMSEQDPVSR